MTTVYTYSSELLTNYALNTVMRPELAFRALQTNDGHALLFSIGSDNVLYVLVEKPGTRTGWEKIALSKSLPAGRTGAPAVVKSFAVAQDWGAGTIDLAVVLDGDPAQKLYLCLGNPTSGTAWMAAPTWQAAPYDDADHMAPFRFVIQNVFINPAPGGRYIGVDILRDASSPDPQIFRYFLDPAKALSGQIWNACDVPADFSAARIKSVIGRRAGDSVDGFYSVGAAGGNTVVFQPLYNSFEWRVAPNPARLELPNGLVATALTTMPASGGATHLFVAAGQELYFFAADNQHDRARGTRIASNPVFRDTRELYCFVSGNSVTVISLNRANQVVRIQCPTARVSEFAGWSHPIPICSGIQQASPYVNHATGANTIFLETGNNQLHRSTQSRETSAWLCDNILLPVPDTAKARQSSSYTTRIQASDEAKRPLAKTPVQLSALSRLGVYINGVYYVLDQQPIPVDTDDSGCLVVVEWVDTLSGTPLRIHGTGGAVISINPMDKAFKRVATLNTVAALSGAQITNADGTSRPLIAPGQNNSDLQKVATALGALNEVYGTLPADGSVVRTQRLRAAAASGSGSKRRFEVLASVTVGGSPPPARMLAAAAALDIGSAITVAAGDLLEWLKSGAEYVVQIVKDTASGIYSFVAEIAGRLYTFVYDSISTVVASIESIFKALKTAIEDLIRFLKFLFDWKDFLRTRDVVKKIIVFSLNLGLDDLEKLKADFNGLIADAKTKVDNWAAIKQDAWTPVVTNGDKSLGYLQTVTDVAQIVTAPAMFLVDHLRANFGRSSGGDTSPLQLDNAVLTRAINAVENQQDVLVNAIGRIESQVLDVSAYATLSTAEVLKRIAAVAVDALLNSSQTLIDALIDALVILGRGALQVLDTPIRIPVVSDILEDAFGVSASFSLLDAIVLAAAIPATIGYKLMVGSAPFPPGDAFGDKVMRAQTLQELAAQFAPAPPHRALMATAGVSSQLKEWRPINLPSNVRNSVYLISYLIAGIGGILGSVMSIPSLASDDAVSPQYEKALAICGAVAGFSSGLAVVFLSPCAIQNQYIARLATAAGALTVIGKIGFYAVVSKVAASGNTEQERIQARESAKNWKKVGAGFDGTIALIGLVPTCYHFYELKNTDASHRKSEAILNEIANVSTALSRLSAFGARMARDERAKLGFAAAMTALTGLSGMFQISEAIVESVHLGESD